MEHEEETWYMFWKRNYEKKNIMKKKIWEWKNMR